MVKSSSVLLTVRIFFFRERFSFLSIRPAPHLSSWPPVFSSCPFLRFLLLIFESPPCSSVPSVVAGVAFLRALCVYLVSVVPCHAVLEPIQVCPPPALQCRNCNPAMIGWQPCMRQAGTSLPSTAHLFQITGPGQSTQAKTACNRAKFVDYKFLTYPITCSKSAQQHPECVRKWFPITDPNRGVTLVH